MKKLISLVLCVVMLASLACLGVSAATDGTAINTAEEFAAMKADGNYYLNADIAINTTYVEPFTGTFDGNGHTVTVTVPMFAQFDGTVKDLTIDGVELTGAENLAAFAIYSQTMTAINVTNKVDITVTGATLDENGNIVSGAAAGGLVADTWKDTDCKIVLRNCVNYGNITNAADGGTGTWIRAGGLVGYAEALDAKFCQNYGDISVPTATRGQAGGIAGGAAMGGYITEVNVEYCTIEANITSTWDAGGIFGYVGHKNNTFNVPYVFNGCTVIGNVTASYRCGGIVGYAYCTSSNDGEYVVISNSLVVGTVSGGYASTTSEGKSQYAYTSFFLGYGNSVYNTVQNCVAIGELKTLEGETFADNHYKVFMGCSSAKTPEMPIENVFICDNNTTEWYSWASSSDNDAQKIKLEEYLGTKITRCTEDEMKSGAILTKLNAYAGEEVFVQTAGTDPYPTINPAIVTKAQEQDVLPSTETEAETTTAKKDETTTTAKNEDNKTTTPNDTTTAAPISGDDTPATTTTAGGDETKSGGCGSVVALGLMAMLIPAAVVVVKKKEK